MLELLAERGPCALYELHDGSGLPKTTLRRLLATLAKRNFVRRGISDGVYRLNLALPAQRDESHVGRVARLVRAASPCMLALTRSTTWPSDLHVYFDGRMKIVESTHALSPFGQSKRQVCENEINLFAAASGIAYLSTLSDEQIDAKIDELQGHELWRLSRLGVRRARLFKEIARARVTGYGKRLVSQTDSLGFTAIAAPIRSKEGCVGAISLWWQQSYLDSQNFAERHGGALSSAARTIGRDFDALTRHPQPAPIAKSLTRESFSPP